MTSRTPQFAIFNLQFAIDFSLCVVYNIAEPGKGGTPVRTELYEYEIKPICFLANNESTGRAGEETALRIRALNRKFEFRPGNVYYLRLLETAKAENVRFPGTDCERRFALEPDEEGVLTLSASFPREGMYQIQILDGENGKPAAELRVYALDGDMRGRYPFRGDLHMHTCRSDGREDPFTVCANYRAHGYDFTIISDHNRYYPSLEAREKFMIGDDDESPITGLLVIPGEEVHLPFNAVHYVNCGSSFSINALVTPSKNEEKGGTDPRWRSTDGNCPPVMTKDEFEEMIRERAKGIDRELESERLSMAVAEWTYEMVKKGGGLGIFPHPYWLCKSMQLSEDYVYYYYERRPFDAFEVLGGESYYQHNGFQTAFYYENRARGLNYPVVGSTDSHGSTERNRNALICSTIVFSPKNKVRELIDSIKEGKSVAIDTISAEYRAVGEFRFIKYASFLMENWYPLHDQACAAEGYYMKRFADGDESAEAVLRAVRGIPERLMSEFFSLD